MALHSSTEQQRSGRAIRNPGMLASTWHHHGMRVNVGTSLWGITERAVGEEHEVSKRISCCKDVEVETEPPPALHQHVHTYERALIAKPALHGLWD